MVIIDAIHLIDVRLTFQNTSLVRNIVYLNEMVCALNPKEGIILNYGGSDYFLNKQD